ncbi:MAG: hypothetical protein P8Y34_03840, partial [Anaerolineales bacterium]
VILRIILVLITGTVIGAVIYFNAVGWIPYFEQRIFQPIDSHQQEIRRLQATQGSLETHIAGLSTALDAVRSGELQPTQQALTTNLSDLENALDALESRVDENSYYSATLNPSLLSTAAARQQALDRNLSALATAQMEDARKSQEIDLLKVLVLLNRTKQFLMDDNFGLAEDTLATIEEYLLKIGSSPAGIDQQASELLNLIDGASADLPYRPEIAADKLELAWELTLTGMLNPAGRGTVTPTPYEPTPPDTTPTPTPN